jgi:hypothetical protein
MVRNELHCGMYFGLSLAPVGFATFAFLGSAPKPDSVRPYPIIGYGWPTDLAARAVATIG